VPHLLVVEDERDLSRLIARAFTREGYTVAEAATVREARASLARRPPACVLLDLMLPDASGLDLVRELKAAPATRHLPVVLVTARSEEVDRVVGFELGADDYVSKPFSPRELVLRVQAILRRLAPPVAVPVAAGRIAVDEEGHVASVAGRTLPLTALEFRLLAHLARNAGRVLTRASLLDAVWGAAADVTDRTVDAHIRRLRAKLGPARGWLETLRGVGYRLKAS